MDCKAFYTRLDDYLDHRLDTADAEDCRLHAAACAGCRSRLAREQQLLHLLRELPAPSPSPGFATRVLRAAHEAHRPARRPWSVLTPTFAYALAASLALGIGLAVWLDADEAPAPQVAVATTEPAEAMRVINAERDQPTPVRLVFRSPRALSDVTIEVELPEGAELAAYPGRRTLSWKTGLQAGANLLELPVIVHGEGGVLTARLTHGSNSRQFTVALRTRPRPGQSSVPPVTDSTALNITVFTTRKVAYQEVSRHA